MRTSPSRSLIETASTIIRRTEIVVICVEKAERVGYDGRQNNTNTQLDFGKAIWDLFMDIINDWVPIAAEIRRSQPETHEAARRLLKAMGRLGQKTQQFLWEHDYLVDWDGEAPRYRVKYRWGVNELHYIRDKAPTGDWVDGLDSIKMIFKSFHNELSHSLKDFQRDTRSNPVKTINTPADPGKKHWLDWYYDRIDAMKRGRSFVDGETKAHRPRIDAMKLIKALSAPGDVKAASEWIEDLALTVNLGNEVYYRMNAVADVINYAAQTAESAGVKPKSGRVLIPFPSLADLLDMVMRMLPEYGKKLMKNWRDQPRSLQFDYDDETVDLTGWANGIDFAVEQFNSTVNRKSKAFRAGLNNGRVDIDAYGEIKDTAMAMMGATFMLNEDLPDSMALPLTIDDRVGDMMGEWEIIPGAKSILIGV